MEIKDKIKSIIKGKDLEKLKSGDLTLYTRLLKEGGKDVHKRKNRMLTLKPGSNVRLPPPPEEDEEL